MLILTRRVDQEIIIGDSIIIKVIRLARRQVALAIQAPNEIAIDRAEIRLQKQATRGESNA